MAQQSTSDREWKSKFKNVAEDVEMRFIFALFGEENYKKFPARVQASKKYINCLYDAVSAKKDRDGNIIRKSKKKLKAMKIILNLLIMLYYYLSYFLLSLQHSHTIISFLYVTPHNRVYRTSPLLNLI